MALLLEVLNGQEQGKQLLIEAGYTVGRTQGDIALHDPKVSGLHAKIESDTKGNLILIDQKSANGILLNGQKITRLTLLPGVEFQLGSTKLRVAEPAPIKVIPAVEVPPPPVETPKNWNVRLYESLESLLDLPPQEDAQVNSNVAAFNPPLNLEFIQGVNFGKNLVLGFGPRTMGASNFDIQIEEPTAPNVLCEFSLGPDCAIVTDLSQGLLLLNSKNISSEILSDGDILSIGETKIRVSYGY